MPIRRSKYLVKRLFENQHKLTIFVRSCSSSLRYKEWDDPIQGIAEPDYKSEPIHNDTFKYEDLKVRLAAPNQLQAKPDGVVELGFGKYFTDHMLTVEYHKNKGGWNNPNITPFKNLEIHPAAKVLHYAVELFEGMKAYRGVDDKIRLFRPELNMQRMIKAAERSGLPIFDQEELIKCIKRLISVDQEWVPHCETSSSLYIRPTLIGTDGTLGVQAPESSLLYVILSPVSSYYRSNGDGSVSMYADPTVLRAWPGGVGNRKVGSNYGPTIEIQSRASKLGHHQVLWLYGPNQEITEVGAMNVFMVYINDNGDKQLATPPLNGLILPGVTRRSIIEIASQWEDIIVKEEVITMDRITQLNREERLLEIFGSGTAVVISPVSSIGYLGELIKVPTMQQTHPLYKRVKDTLTAIQYGHIEHPWARVI